MVTEEINEKGIHLYHNSYLLYSKEFINYIMSQIYIQKLLRYKSTALELANTNISNTLSQS
jgi:hypothetical protein